MILNWVSSDQENSGEISRLDSVIWQYVLPKQEGRGNLVSGEMRVTGKFHHEFQSFTQAIQHPQIQKTFKMLLSTLFKNERVTPKGLFSAVAPSRFQFVPSDPLQ